MSAQRIDPVLVEKAIAARREALGLNGLGDELPGMEAALRVVFDELGLKEEREARKGSSRPWVPITEDDLTELYPGTEVRCRPIGDWRPVEQGDE